MLTVKPWQGNMSFVRTALEPLVNAWLDTHASDRTRSAYARDVAAYLAWCLPAGRDPLDSQVVDLDAYREVSLADGASSSTVARRLSAIGSFFRHAAAAGLVDDNPVRRVDRPTPATVAPAVLDCREVAALIDAAEHLGPKPAALVALLALDGIKLNQVLAINIPRVHLAGAAKQAMSWVDVERHGERQQVPITAESARLVGAHIASRRRGPLFLGDSPTRDRPGRLTRFGADFLIKRASAVASLRKPVSANVLRRSYVEAARQAGTPLEDIAGQVGHRESRDTARLLDRAAT